MNLEKIEETVQNFINSLPVGVALVAAAKTRSAEEVQVAVRAGVKILGYNYVQEAEQIHAVIGRQAQWHLIGHLQRNKAKRAVRLFDLIETLDSLDLAQLLNNLCAESSGVMPVFIEVNSGREPNKTGVLPEAVPALVEAVSALKNIRVQGLMTMGPFPEPAEALRPFFKETRKLFDQIAQARLPGVEMRYLSMGMSDSYLVAIEEGANIVRIGTKLFGPR